MIFWRKFKIVKLEKRQIDLTEDLKKIRKILDDINKEMITLPRKKITKNPQYINLRYKEDLYKDKEKKAQKELDKVTEKVMQMGMAA